LFFHVDSKVPVIGSVLKTTCGPDEVCLADQVEEIGEAFPNKKLELILRTTRPPVISFHKDERAIP
uniref:BPI2 domain-containing protein n=1 Tax=Heligmosomoides polygyrus TaxID=6339 RepID=A0A183G8D6_HELPZ